jgi:nucleotide-binding universal stress UspA family protein
MFYGRILVPVDNSQASRASLGEAIRLAGGKGKIRLVYVVDDGYPVDDEACDFIDFEAMQTAATGTGERTLMCAGETVRKSGAKADTALIYSEGEHAARLIEREASVWNADLIVIGGSDASDCASMQLGRVRNQVLRIPSIPVLPVREARGLSHSPAVDAKAKVMNLYPHGARHPSARV